MAEFPASLNLGTLNGTTGFRLDGVAAGDQSGFSVSSAGDVNGDGYADLIFGAPFADPNGSLSGASYVVFGRSGGFGATINLASLNGTTGFRLTGTAGDFSGRSVSSAGDVNGDGFDDVIVGAPYADPNGSRSGTSYVVFGRAAGFAPSLNLGTLDGSNGFRLDGASFPGFSGGSQGELSGWSVSSAGDVNGDGIDDLIIGAPGSGAGDVFAGASYVVFGRVGGFAPRLTLAGLDGTDGFRLDGAIGDGAGVSVSSAGDVNGDGFDDIIVGSPGDDPNGYSSGSTYVVFGRSGGFSPNLDLSSLDGRNGFQLVGAAGVDRSGFSVSSAGDVNGDGFDDLIVGARGVDPNGSYSGASYVVFGTDRGFAASLNLGSLDGRNGFRLTGAAAGDQAGWSVSSAGDVNGDGFADLIVGARYADASGAESGASYVVFGTDRGFGASLNLGSLDGRNGFRIEGVSSGDASGISVSSAGDVNGDGFDDLVVGAQGADPNGATDAGASYVVFGRAPDRAVTRQGTETANTIRGGAFGDDLRGRGGDDRLFGGAGNDSLSGDGGNDRLDGGTGADRLRGGDGDDRLDGGAGADRMEGEAGNDLYVVDDAGDDVRESFGQGLDSVLASISYTLGDSVENLTLTGSANLNGSGNGLDNRIIGNAGRNILTGGLGNDTLDGGGGVDRLSGGLGDDVFVVNNAGVVVSEAAGEGTDTVRATGNYSLGANLENLVLTGAGGNGTGNALANTLTGNAGNNVLDGKGGADTMIGGLGNDTYVVDNVGDVIVELAGQGTDGVRAAISYTLAENVERLELTSVSNIAGTGNALANTIVGGSGANTLTGLSGRDTLTGGAGRDTFVFAALSDSTVAAGGRDTITDFTQSDTDRIDLRGIDANTALTGDQAFTWIGASAFTGTAGQLHYETSGTNTLVSGDVDGNGAADFAILLTGQLALTRGDFLL